MQNENIGGDFPSANPPTKQYHGLSKLSLCTSFGEAVSSLVSGAWLTPVYSWLLPWPDLGLPCAAQLPTEVLQSKAWGCSNVIWAVSYLLEACASTKATRLHSLTLTGSRRPQDFPTFDPISCVDGAQSLKPSFNLPSSLQNVYSDKWSSGEGCWIGWKCSVPGCILYFDYHIDAST